MESGDCGRGGLGPASAGQSSRKASVCELSKKSARVSLAYFSFFWLGLQRYTWAFSSCGEHGAIL